jgi:hypothetical protein
MTTIINAVASTGLTQSPDGSGIIKVQSNGVTTNALAWVNFDGTASTPITPRANYNVSSVTKSATGVYVLNFTNSLTDINYSALISISQSSGASVLVANTQCNSSGNVTPTTSALSVYVVNRSAGSATDAPYVNVAVFGN